MPPTDKADKEMFMWLTLDSDGYEIEGETDSPWDAMRWFIQGLPPDLLRVKLVVHYEKGPPQELVVDRVKSA